jgi:hypothetical protein
MPPIGRRCSATAARRRHRARMKTHWFVVIFVAAGCASDPEADGFSPLDEQSKPNPDGKSDEVRACGAQSCVPRLCGYDCATAGSQCTEACGAEDARAQAFVTATVSGAESTTFDSRATPFDPVFALDNVLVYGCELWDFSDGSKDGLEIQFEELVHSSFVVDPNDPTRYDRKLDVYVAPFTGPGSYRGEALYTSRHDAPRYYAKDGCAVDVSTDAAHGARGTFRCDLARRDGGGAVTVTGEFGCPVNAMNPIFSRRR